VRQTIARRQEASVHPLLHTRPAAGRSLRNQDRSPVLTASARLQRARDGIATLQRVLHSAAVRGMRLWSADVLGSTAPSSSLTTTAHGLRPSSVILTASSWPCVHGPPLPQHRRRTLMTTCSSSAWHTQLERTVPAPVSAAGRQWQSGVKPELVWHGVDCMCAIRLRYDYPVRMVDLVKMCRRSLPRISSHTIRDPRWRGHQAVATAAQRHHHVVHDHAMSSSSSA